MTLDDWIDKNGRGKFKDMDFSKVLKAGWVDWVCPESRLEGKTAKCAKVLRRVTDAVLLESEVEIRNLLLDGRDVDRILLRGKIQMEITLPSRGYIIDCDGRRYELKDARTCAKTMDELAAGLAPPRTR